MLTIDAGRPVARRGLDFCYLGNAARNHARPSIASGRNGKTRPARLGGDYRLDRPGRSPLTGICFTWIFFRAVDLDHAGIIAKSFCVLAECGGRADLGIRMIWIVVLLGIIHRLNGRAGVFSTWWRRGFARDVLPRDTVARLPSCSYFIPAK